MAVSAWHAAIGFNDLSPHTKWLFFDPADPANSDVSPAIAPKAVLHEESYAIDPSDKDHAIDLLTVRLQTIAARLALGQPIVASLKQNVPVGTVVPLAQMTVDTQRPDSTAAVTGWEANPHLKLINNGAGVPPTSADTDALSVAGEYVATLVNADTFTVGLGTFTLGTDVVSQAKAWIRWRGTLTMNLIVPTLGTIATVSIATGGTVTTSSATFTGSLTQAQIDGMQIQVNSTAAQSPNARVGWAFVETTHAAGGGVTVKQLAALGVG